MNALIAMASSPQYLAPSAHTPEHIEIDSNTTVLPDSIAQPTAVTYSHPDQGQYSEISHVSTFGTSPLVDDHLLTPISSAASPPLQPKYKSAYDHEEESLHYSQQPTPPHNATMYSTYPDYMHGTSQATSSMSMQAVVAESSDHFFMQDSPGPEDTIPPPQPKLYLGAFGASNVSVAPEPDSYPGYLHHSGMDSSLGLLRADVNAGSYTHRPLAPSAMTQAPSMPSLLHHSPADVDHYRQIPLPRLSPAAHPGRSQSTNKRDPQRKARRRRATPPMQTMYPINEALAPGMMEDDGPDGEVTLDDKAPQELQRLWDIRKKYLSRKGNGMWEDIMAEYYNDDHMTSENKKTQLKAGLQMKIHRMLLKHGVWPQRDEGALLRAYRRWEENRYIEILRLFEEEMGGRKKAYDWKSQHVEAQLVKMGLEEPERDRESKARKRKQVAARHQSRGSSSATATVMRQQQSVVAGAGASSLQGQHRLPTMPLYHDQPPSSYYGQPGGGGGAPGHYRASSYDAAAVTQQLAQELGANPPDLDDAQRDQLVEEALERAAPYDLMEEDDDQQQQQDVAAGEDADKMSDPYSHHPHHLHHEQQHQPPSHGLPLPHWEPARPRTTSASLIHPALSGTNTSAHNSPYPPPGTPGGSAAAGRGSPDYDAQRGTSMARSSMEDTLSRSAYA